jgi:hypothetical protein
VRLVGSLKLSEKAGDFRNLPGDNKLISRQEVIQCPLVFQVPNKPLPMIFACGGALGSFCDRSVKIFDDLFQAVATIPFLAGNSAEALCHLRIRCEFGM